MYERKGESDDEEARQGFWLLYSREGNRVPSSRRDGIGGGTMVVTGMPLCRWSWWQKEVPGN